MKEQVVPRRIVLLLLATCFFTSSCVHTAGSRVDGRYARLVAHDANAPLMVVAHRGLWREAPENSLGAIELAIKAGADVVEADIRMTRDDELVLMHDATVTRTTNGSGKVADLTLDEIKSLRLKKGLGGDHADLTNDRVPTLAEALHVVKKRAFLALDKGWPVREEMLRVLQRTGTVDDALFMGSPPLAEASAFMETHPEIHYVHLVDRDNVSDIGRFPGRSPVAYAVVFDRQDDPQVQPRAIAQIRETSRLWLNTMWYGFAGEYTDEASLRDPASGWEALVRKFGANIIQTDQVRALNHWRQGGSLEAWPSQSGKPFVRIQAEEFVEGHAAADRRPADPGRCTVVRTDEGIDVCDFNGAIAVRMTESGEWLRYRLVVTDPGEYRVSVRVSSRYSSAGTIMLAWDSAAPAPPIEIHGTTNDGAFELEPLENRLLPRGAHELLVTIAPNSPPDFNIDYFQLDRLEP